MTTADDFTEAARAALEPTAAEHRIARLEAQTDIRGRAVVIYRERAREAEARIADALALCDEWEAFGTRSMNIGAVRRALEG